MGEARHPGSKRSMRCSPAESYGSERFCRGAGPRHLELLRALLALGGVLAWGVVLYLLGTS